MKIREPALLIGVVVAVISLLGTLGFTFLSMDQAGLWVAVVNAVAAAFLAWTVRPISPAIFTYVVGVLVALGTGYGLEFTPEQVAAVNGMVVPALTLITRNQVSPIDTPVTAITPNPTPEAAATNQPS